jgi:uncharacterized protein (TIGR03437 family)
VDPAGQDGETIVGYKNVRLPVKVTIGGVDVPLIGGAALIYTGEIQVSASVPNNVPTGNVPLVLTIGTSTSRSDVTVAVK